MTTAVLLHGQYGQVSWQMDLTLGMVLVALAGLVWAVLGRHGRGE